MDIEKTLVHNTYDRIAHHFSETRFSVWDCVEEFIKNIKPNSIILDNGCGNGKNMNRKDCFYVGLDTCKSFIDIVYSKGHECMIANCKKLPYLNDTFDYCISIAVIHHIYNMQDRIECIKEMIRVTKSGGYILISVWSKHKNYKFGDNIIPWNIRNTDIIVPRYYYLFTENEVKQLVDGLNVDIVSLQNSKNNYFLTLLVR